MLMWLLNTTPTGIVVKSKAPRKKPDNYLEQLETYIFHKYGRNRLTLAILTDGDKFNVYGITGALYKGSLGEYRILSFTRADLVSATLLPQLLDVLGKQSNKNGAIGDAIAGCQKHQERLGIIEGELRTLTAERERVDSRIHALETERKGIIGFSDRRYDKPKVIPSPSNVYKFPSSQHIVTLLQDKGESSQSEGVPRKWLDEQLINKVEGVQTQAAVSHGIIEITSNGIGDHEGGKNSGRPIGKVWLLEAHEKSAI